MGYDINSIKKNEPPRSLLRGGSFEETLSEHDRLEDLFSKQLIAVREKNDVKTAPISSGDFFTF
jgi:hypothetical protein